MPDLQTVLLGGRRIHVVFCAVVLGLIGLCVWLLHLTGFRFDNWISVCADAGLFLGSVYLGRWLCARWYLRRHYLLFALFSLAAVIGITVIKWMLVRYLAHYPLAGYLEVSRGSAPFFLIGLLAGMSLKLIRWVLRREMQEVSARARQKESEFQLLQAQLSPHFLFNVLNNLYGISIQNPARMPGLLIKLSQLLRYSVYSSRSSFVPLTDELEYIRTYVEFEQIRLSDRLDLELVFEAVPDPTIRIAPLVLIVFVENAFKHARNNLDRRIYVGLTLHVCDDQIRFTVVNSWRAEPRPANTNTEGAGVGLANTLQRLKLLYGNAFRLEQSAENDRYFVELSLKIVHGKADPVSDRR